MAVISCVLVPRHGVQLDLATTGLQQSLAKPKQQDPTMIKPKQEGLTMIQPKQEDPGLP